MFEYLNSITIGLLLFIIFNLLKGRLDFEEIWKKVEPVNNLLEFIGKAPKWLDYYHSLNANEQDLRHKIEWLRARMRDISVRVKNEESRKLRLRKREVDVWLTSVATKETEVQAILEQIDRVTDNFYWFLHRAWLGSRVEIMIQQVDDLFNSGVFEEVLSSVRETPELVIGTLVGAAARDNIRRILEWLESGVKLIAVHGIEGIGKTEILKRIHNQLLRRTINLKVCMIQVPENFTVSTLQRCIAKELLQVDDLPDEDELMRAAWLNRALKRKNFVLILDGLGRYFPVQDVGIPLEADQGKMVISSRSLDVCRRMGCRPQSTIAVDPLARNDALELFKRELELELPLEPALEALAVQIVEQCQGVPKRIVDNAIPLRRVDDINVWENRLNEMLLPDA